MKRYQLRYQLIEGSETAAKAFCRRENLSATRYIRKNKPAHYAPYEIRDNYGTGKHWNGFICWYYA